MSRLAAKSNSAKNAKPLLIGQLARLAGITPDSVRFYEREGLLGRPQRLASGYRAYDPAPLKRLRFIKKAQALGFSLGDVRRILELRERGQPACGGVMQLAQKTLDGAEARLAQLTSFVTALRSNLARWRRLPANCKTASEFCDLIESTSTPDEHASR